MDAPTPDDAGFHRWLAVRAPALRRRAYLLAGSWHAADDLLQDTLVAAYANWPRIARTRDIDSYLNRVLVNKFIDGRRRPWRREHPVDDLPDGTDRSAADALDAVERSDSALAQALARLPSLQRAVVVLRFDHDLSIEQIADVLNISSGTVKSRLSRATATLRERLEARPPATVTSVPNPDDESNDTEELR